MNIFQGIGKLSITQKICLSGLFISLVAILQKIIAINYLAGLPFFRISFGGPAVIIFSSIFLGPFWGAIVGLFSDLLGYFAFDASSMVYLPQVGIIYLVLGFFSYYIFNFFIKIKNTKLLKLFEFLTFGVIFVGVSLYILFIFECDIVFKILIPVGLCVFFFGLICFIKMYKNETAIWPTLNISFSCFIIDLLILVLFGSIMKTWAFSIYYDNIFTLWISIIVSQSVVLFFNVIFNTMVISLFLRLTKKYIPSTRSNL